MYDYKKIKKQIDKCEYISFDMFDTLIKRNIDRPTDIFDLIENEYNKNNKPKLKNFKDIRIFSERKAREVIENKEPNIDDIYNVMKIKNKDKLKKLEIELELKLCQQNIDFYSIYRYAKENGKKIIITTDMYLTKNIIRKILKNANIEYDYLFLSNDVKLNKHGGKIYPYILNKLNISSHELLHIGDSKRADFLMPKIYGVKAILIPKRINKLRYYKKYEPTTIDEKIIINFINNNIPYEEDIYYKIGYEILGIILFGYCKWLKSNVEKEKIKKLFFLSREGLLLKKAFDLMNENKIESKYLYVSRRSTRPSFLKDINSLDEVFSICKMRRVIDLESFFINVGLDIDCYGKILKKYNVKKEDNIKNIKNFEDIFYDIKDEIVTNAKEEEINLVGYLKQEGFLGKIGICDIGWSGTMQSSLTNISFQNKIDTEIIGFYIGQLSTASKNIQAGNKQYGYLFNYKSDEREIRAFISLFENLFSSAHGTTLKYKKENNTISPVLAPYEYSKQEDKIFRNIQNGAINFMKQIVVLEKLDLNFSNAFASFGIKKLGLTPTLDDVKLFGDITYLDTKIFKLANSHNLIYYLFRPKKLASDILNSNWKVGFLKKLFKININYYKIYKILVGDNQ